MHTKVFIQIYTDNSIQSNNHKLLCCNIFIDVCWLSWLFINLCWFTNQQVKKKEKETLISPVSLPTLSICGFWLTAAKRWVGNSHCRNERAGSRGQIPGPQGLASSTTSVSARLAHMGANGWWSETHCIVCEAHVTCRCQKSNTHAQVFWHGAQIVLYCVFLIQIKLG